MLFLRQATPCTTYNGAPGYRELHATIQLPGSSTWNTDGQNLQLSFFKHTVVQPYQNRCLCASNDGPLAMVTGNLVLRSDNNALTHEHLDYVRSLWTLYFQQPHARVIVAGSEEQHTLSRYYRVHGMQYRDPLSTGWNISAPQQTKGLVTIHDVRPRIAQNVFTRFHMSSFNYWEG